jgi:thioredoxin reductase
MNPRELLEIAREQLKPYPVKLVHSTVMSVCQTEDGFEVGLLDGPVMRARKILLATGVVDRMPDVEGIDLFYGTSVHHCPYCDGWEHRDQPIAVYGKGSGGMSLALTLKTWSKDIVLCTDGPAGMRGRERLRLKRQSIEVYEARIKRLDGLDGRLTRIDLEDGTSLHRTAMFFSTGHVQRSKLPIDLSCSLTPKGAVRMSRKQASTTPGVYVAGDACYDVHYVVVAAAEGAKAAIAINARLQQEDQALADPDRESAKMLEPESA